MKYLGKRYGLSNVSICLRSLPLISHLTLKMRPWQEAMKAADHNGDNRISFLEFQDAIKMAEKAVSSAVEEEK